MKSRYLSLVIPTLLLFLGGAPGYSAGNATRELEIHLAQANNDSPYALVRAKFEPGEVTDPWAVRFYDEGGKEIPYFVWDSVSWRVAREGREDWGKRFALINHAPGDAPEALAARAQKLEWAKASLPALGARLEAQDRAATQAPESQCAAMYLLRYHLPAFGKSRVTMRIFGQRQVEPEQQRWSGQKVEQRISIQQGDLAFSGLPDRLAVSVKGKEIFHYAGFQAGNASGESSHADPARPYTIEKLAGIITRIHITGQTNGRNNAPMNWQSTYWIFPEGGYVALEGFSLGDPAGYRGGPQKLSIWQAPADFNEVHKPTWDAPWWVHQAGAGGFVSTHLLYGVSLATGYGNNPFTINAEGNGREPDMQRTGNQLSLGWTHQLNDPATARVHAPEPIPRPGVLPDSLKPAEVAWKPGIDWLYRQYLVGAGPNAETSTNALRDVLGAAAGWIDRPLDEEAVASTVVDIIKKLPIDHIGTEYDQLMVTTPIMNGDLAGARSYLSRARNQSEKADFYIATMRDFVARGGKPAGGSHVDSDGVRREGFTGNPCYFAHLLPDYLRVFDFFDLSYPRDQYRAAVTRFADFSMESIGGKPFDLQKWNTTLEQEWPSRVVPAIPLMISANELRPDKQYVNSATILFDDLMHHVEANPHGYFPVWSFRPEAVHWDTVYNPVSYSRGLASFWTEDKLDWIGRERASHFVAAQVRWMVFSGQLLDTLETDNVCAIRAATHHGHTNSRTQLGLYLLDDFAFYRGLVGGVIDWSAAAWQDPQPLFPIGTGPYRSLSIEGPILRWALDIRPGSKWSESKVVPLPQRHGFKVQAWNRIASAKPTIKILGTDAGLTSGAEVLRIELTGASYRVPAEFTFTQEGGKKRIEVSKDALVHLSYRALWPDLPANCKPFLKKQGSDGKTERVSDAALTNDGAIEWHAVAGVYELDHS